MMSSVNKTTPPLSRSAHAHFDLNVQSLRFAVDDDDDDEHEMDEDNLMNIESERRMITESGTGSVPISIAFPRGQWKEEFDFLVSCSVGLGSVWRFPFLCFKHGGGTFLVVYALFFVLVAVPIVILEVTMGQHLKRGAMEMWKMCPVFKGVGIGNMIMCGMLIWYFGIIVSWSLFYMIHSFAHTFPWETCGNDWNNVAGVTCVADNNTGMASSIANAIGKSQSSVEQYWERHVLQLSPSLFQFEAIRWELAALLLVIWAVVYFALWKGITQARWFIYFCPAYTYTLLVVLLFRGVSLEGAQIGIDHFLRPDLTRLRDVTLWQDAGTQALYSYGIGFGGLIARGSHNKPGQNCLRDALLLCCVGVVASTLSCFAIFSILGFMAHSANKPFTEVVKPGVGLAFLVFPEVASKLPLKQVWSFLFFLMITILGLNSLVGLVGALFTGLQDSAPILLRKYKKYSLLVASLFFILIGLPMTTHAGVHWITLIDTYGASGIPLLFVVFFEVVGLAWGFGTHYIRTALKGMVKMKAPLALNFFWKYTAPLSTLLLFFICVIRYKSLAYPSGEKYSWEAQVLGFCLSAASILAVPGWVLYFLFISKHDDLKPMERLRQGIHPPDESKYMDQPEEESSSSTSSKSESKDRKSVV